MDIYSTLDDYAAAIVAPALESSDNITVTRGQLLEIAGRMTVWHDEYTTGGDINLNKSGYIEDDTADFWETVAAVIED